MRDTSKAWLVKVYTDLGTRLLVVIEPHLRVKDLQGDSLHPKGNRREACNMHTFPQDSYEGADPISGHDEQRLKH